MDATAAGPGLVNAQLVATVAYADAASGASKAIVYSGYPAADPRGIPEGAVLGEVVFKKPCGIVAGETLTLQAANPSGGMVLVGGFPRWVRWERSDGQLVFAGPATDMDHGGFFRFQGGYTPEGETSPLLQAGGVLLLGNLVLG